VKSETCRAASQQANSAVTPTKTCPHPETAVNAADRSMVSRIKRRSSAALGDGAARCPTHEACRNRRKRCGRESDMKKSRQNAAHGTRLACGNDRVKYFAA
jgi:hypothetical protein